MYPYHHVGLLALPLRRPQAARLAKHLRVRRGLEHSELTADWMRLVVEAQALVSEG